MVFERLTARCGKSEGSGRERDPKPSSSRVTGVGGVASPPLNEFLNPRIPSPKPFPSSGSFFGPKTSRATPRITSKCIGCKRPSNMANDLRLGFALSMRERRFQSACHCILGRTAAGLVCDGDLARDLERLVAVQVHEVRRLVDRRMERDVADQGVGEVRVLLRG